MNLHTKGHYLILRDSNTENFGCYNYSQTSNSEESNFRITVTNLTVPAKLPLLQYNFTSDYSNSDESKPWIT